jgi:ribosomal protein L21E
VFGLKNLFRSRKKFRNPKTAVNEKLIAAVRAWEIIKNHNDPRHIYIDPAPLQAQPLTDFDGYTGPAEAGNHRH